MNEILALEELGLRIRIVSIHPSDTRLTHQQTRSIRAPVYYIPESFWVELPRMLIAQAHFLRRYPGRWIRAYNVMFWRFNLKAVKRWLQSGRVAQHLETSDTGHVHAHFSTSPTTIAMMTSILLGLRFSFTCHAKDVYADDRLHSPGFLRNLTRASFAVCVSAKTKRDILDAWPGLPSRKIHVVYNGLDMDRFPRRSSEPREPLILAVGRLVEKKGLPYLVEACRLLKERSVPFKCEIVGYGEMRKRLAEQISRFELNDQVELIGPLAQHELVKYYEGARVFCLPTIIAENDDRDVLPNVLKEAMAVGLPVVTTNLPGMDELVENECTGLLVPPKSPPAIADALERLLHDGKLGILFREGGRKVIEERFDRRKNVAQLFKLFERYLAS
jgi:glycosyltransferase involved in cell wall biosynthesis